MTLSRRFLLSVGLAAGLAGLAGSALAQAPKEIRLDFATYNPVSLVLKEKGLLEKALEKDGIAVRWVQTLGSNKALEFLNAGSIDFGSTAGSAALVAKINGNPDQVDLRLFAARMDGARHAQGDRHRQGRRSQGQARRRHARHRSAHLPRARPRRCGPDREGRAVSCCCSIRTGVSRSSAATSTPGPASTR